MNKGIIKTTIREIKSSFGRYLAILLIAALGVGFFAGLKVTHDVMVHTADTYWGQLNFYDYRLLSTLGFDENAEEKLLSEEDVKDAEGEKSADVLMVKEDDSELVIKTMSVPQRVNLLNLEQGRMPEQADECVVDYHGFDASDIGTTLKISESNSQEDQDLFKIKEYTIVGLVSSPLYIRYDRGNTSIGNGVLDAFVYIEEAAYDMDYDTEIYVVFDKGQDGQKRSLSEDTPVIYSDEYDAFMEKKEETWKTLTQDVAMSRYNRIYQEAEEEIAEGEQDLQEETSKAKQELSEAKKEIDQGRSEISEGEAAIEKAKSEISDNEKKLADSESQYEDGLETYNKSKKEYEEGKKAYEKAKAQYDEAYEKNYPEYEKNLESYNSGKAAYDQSEKEYGEAMASYEAVKEYLSEAEQQQKEAELGVWRTSLDETEVQLSAAKTQLDQAAAQFDTGKQQLEATNEKLTKASKELASAKKELDSAKNQIEEGKKSISSAKSQIVQKEQELSDAKQQLLEGEKEYEDGKQELEDKTAEGQQEIADAREDLADLEQPETYVLGRDTNSGYVNFETDSAIVMGIANVFPVFFFLVAALVCVTTMTRMMEEQRTQVGVLKALGYSDGAVIGKYMTYSVSAFLTGAVVGFLLGTWGFPKVIWTAYQMLYHMGSSYYVFSGKLAVISLVAALLCSGGTTLFCCYQELTENSASLMRPKAPKAGKRVLLERIPAIWSRLKFIDKVSARNLFRYKKRFFMMIVGVSGCTSLLVAAFGIKDSIAHIADDQFGEIFLYDMAVDVKEGEDAGTLELESLEGVSDCLFVLEKSVDVKIDRGTQAVNFLVPERQQDFATYMRLATKAGQEIAFPKKGEVVVTAKLAENANIKVGDTITFQDSDLQEMTATVSGICENYFNHYIIASPETYEDLFGQQPEWNMVFVITDENADEHEVSGSLMKLSQVTNVSVCEDIRQNVSDMMESLNYVVALVIGCAAALAFIVIYNLNNINITERIREIATIKVLGFYKEETKSYIFRENVVLTLLGSLVGIILGHYLHAFIMSAINLDAISFDANVRGVSYLLSVVVTVLFNQLVNLFMTAKLENIHMAESLKSVD